MSLISKAFSDIITFSRSSNATRVGPDGKIAYAPHNLLTYSEDFSNAAWTKTQSSVTANAIASPNGTVTADAFTANGISNPHNVYQTASANAAGRTISVYAKAGTATFLQIWVANSGSPVANFDLVNGTANMVGASSTATITSVGNGWYRCVLASADTAATDVVFAIVSSLSSVRNETNTNSGTLYLWGAQLSLSSIAGDYTLTTSAAVYGPRFDYDPVTLAAKGLLIEEQRTNLATYSEQFDNAAWLKVRSSIQSNVVTAPDGTLTGDKLVEDTTASNDHRIQQDISVTSGTSYTFTFYAKKAERSWVAVQGNGNGLLGLAYYDLANGVTGTVAGGTTATIQSVGNGWYRCSFTRTADSTGTPSIIIYAASGNGGVGYTGDGSSGVYVWGAQLEAGAFATSYIPTIASTVTRSADVASVNTLSPWFNATEGTLYTETASQGNNRIAWLHNTSTGTYDNFLYIVLTSGLNARSEVNVSGVSQASMITANAASALTTAKIAMRYKANDFAVCLNAGAVVTDTSGNIPTVDRLQIGWHTDNVYLNGYIRRLVYYPRRLTNAELQALTA